MSSSLVIASLLVILFIIAIVFYLVRKRRISVKYSLIWLLPCIVMIIFILVPGLMVRISNILGFQSPSNMVIVLLIGFLFVINLALTTIVTNQKDKIRLLIQEISILKEKVNR